MRCAVARQVDFVELPRLLVAAVCRVVAYHKVCAVGLDTVERVFNAFLLQCEAAVAIEVDVVRSGLAFHLRTVGSSLSAIFAPVLSGSEALDSKRLLPRLDFFAFSNRFVAFNGHEALDVVNILIFVAYFISADSE